MTILETRQSNNVFNYSKQTLIKKFKLIYSLSHSLSHETKTWKKYVKDCFFEDLFYVEKFEV